MGLEAHRLRAVVSHGQTIFLPFGRRQLLDPGVHSGRRAKLDLDVLADDRVRADRGALVDTCARRDDGADAQKPRPLRCPVARTSRSIFLTRKDNQRRFILLMI